MFMEVGSNTERRTKEAEEVEIESVCVNPCRVQPPHV